MSPLELLREQIKNKLDERKVVQGQMDELLAGVQERGGDAALTEDEQSKFDLFKRSMTETDDTVKKLRAQETDLAQNEEAREAALVLQRQYGDNGGSTRPTVPARVTSEPEVYTRGGEHSFLHDALVRSLDPEAAARIQRNQAMGRDRLDREGRASVATAGFGALVVPQFLTDMYAEVVRAGRPFLNAVTSNDLPDEGMTLNIPRGTTGTSVLQQTTENTAVASVTFDETTLAVPVCTYAGDQDVSRQAFDRGRNVDQIIMSDLAADYATRVNFDAINGTGTNNRHLGILSTTNGVTTVTFSGTALTTTAAGLHSKVADAIQRVNSTRFMSPTVIFMHPRRWGWLTAAVDTTGRPLVVPNSQSPMNAIGVGRAAEFGQVVGTMLGLPVVTDASIPTTVSSSTISGAAEDVVIVTRAPDVHIFEDSPGPALVEFRETLAGSLSVKIVAWGYSAFTAGRYPSATAIVSGSSLVTPTF
jgi:HK97 family phage major capsid protein